MIHNIDREQVNRAVNSFIYLEASCFSPEQEAYYGGVIDALLCDSSDLAGGFDLRTHKWPCDGDTPIQF